MAAASHGRRSGRPRVEIKDIDIDDITFSSDEEETSKGRSAPSAASLLAAFKTASRAKSPPAVSVSPPPKSSVPDKLVDFDDDEDNAEIDYGDDPFETVDSEPGTLITEEAKPTAIGILEPPTRTLSRSKSFLESLAEMKSHQASSTAPTGLRTEHPGGDDATRPAPTPTIPETNPEPARIPVVAIPALESLYRPSVAINHSSMISPPAKPASEAPAVEPSSSTVSTTSSQVPMVQVVLPAPSLTDLSTPSLVSSKADNNHVPTASSSEPTPGPAAVEPSNPVTSTALVSNSEDAQSNAPAASPSGLTSQVTATPTELSRPGIAGIATAPANVHGPSAVFSMPSMPSNGIALLTGPGSTSASAASNSAKIAPELFTQNTSTSNDNTADRKPLAAKSTTTTEPSEPRQEPLREPVAQPLGCEEEANADLSSSREDSHRAASSGSSSPETGHQTPSNGESERLPQAEIGEFQGALLRSPAAATVAKAVHGGTDEPKVNMETKQLKHPPLQALKGLKDKVRSRKGSRARDSCDLVTRQVGNPQDAVAQTQQERVNELEREKFLLEAKLKELSVSANGTFRDRFAMLSPDAPSPVVEARHLDAIREEMRTMENIISALNEENAKLCASLRGEQIAMKGTTQQMLSRNKALKSELDAAKSEIQELRGSKFVTADEAALDEIRRLKQALVQVRHESEGKIKELQYQLEKQRKVQHELEYKLDNYDPISPRKHHEGDIELRMKIQQMSESHAKEVNELKEKLAWYIKNQTVIDEVENESRAKSETIRNLQQRIEVLQNQSAQNRSKPKPAPAPSSAKYEKKIRELEAQIAGLQSRHGPVNALVKSIKPSASQVEALKKQVTDLQAELVAKDDEYLSRIRSLRLEYDKMRMQYDERIAELTADKRDRDRPNSRIQELEAQIEEMRETYRRKGAVVIQQPSRPGGDKAISRSTRSNADDEGESPMLRSQLNEAMQTITALRSKLEAADKEMQNYRQHIRTLESQPLATGGRAATDKDYDTVIEAMSQAHSSQLEELRRQIETLTVNATKSLDTTASSHLIASLQSQLEIANREKQSLRESLIETQYELSRLRSMPSHVQLSVLEAKLAEIEARHAQREQALHSAMQTLQEQQAAQSSQSSQKYEAIIKEKNAQILQFKTELDAMLATLAELQRSE